jgi:geranylgeranyl diphosphate synthase, type I
MSLNQTQPFIHIASTPSDTPPRLGYREVAERFLPELERRIAGSRLISGLGRDMVQYHLASGGKRMRGVLPIWFCANLGGRPEDAIDLGAGLELIHNATLVHDDAQDGDTHRRGQPTVWSRWGIAQAINVGDALIFEGLARMASAPAAARVLPAIATALARVTDGQVMELALTFPAAFASGTCGLIERWEAIARRKSGALFAACLQAGAAAAGASDELMGRAGHYGEEVGMLFQLQDDVLDLVGDKGRVHRGSDLVEGKLSYAVAWLLEHGGSGDSAPVRSILELPQCERSWPLVEAALSALQRSGATAAAIARLKEVHDALGADPLEALLPEWAAQCLAPIAHALEAHHGR